MCDVCKQEKNTRLPFPISISSKLNTKLELVHLDICSPMSIHSLHDRYFFTFICDYSRMCLVYFLTNKSQVSERFDEFMKNQYGCTLKSLRKDTWIQELYISLLYCTHHNKIEAKRNNCTTMEMAQCFLF